MTSDADVPPEEPGEPPEQPDLDVDAAFAAIVAAWDSDTGRDDPVARWPVIEDLSVAHDHEHHEPDESPVASSDRDAAPSVWRQGPDSLADPVTPTPTPPGSGVESPLSGVGEGPRDGALAEEQFVPPEPLPLPRGDGMLRLAWAGVIGGPLLLVICLIFMTRPLSTWILLLGVGGFIAGFLVLVARMPNDRDDDDGAIV